MTKHKQHLAIGLACVTLAACHLPASLSGKPKAPTGQVVATVDGQEITLRQLTAELAGVNVADPKQRKAIQDLALRNIIARTIFAKAARDQGVDKTADFALMQQRAVDGLLAEALQNKFATSVPAPSSEEVQRFVSDHPELFAQRRVFEVDQITAGRPSDPNIIKQLQPLNTLDEIASLLTTNHIDFKRGSGELDAALMGPQLTAAILKLGPNEVFVIPNGNVILVNAIKDTKIVPLTGEPANTLAAQILKRQHAQEAVQKGMGAIVAKTSPTIRYNPAYQPSKPPAAPAGAPAPTNAAAR